MKDYHINIFYSEEDNGDTHEWDKTENGLRGFLAQGKEAGSAHSRSYVRVMLTQHCVKKTARQPASTSFLRIGSRRGIALFYGKECRKMTLPEKMVEYCQDVVAT